MTLWLLLIGLFTILAQVVLLRELNVAFFGSELVYLLSLGIWLFWTALGAAVGRYREKGSLRGAAWLFLLSGPLLVLDVGFVRRIHLLFGGVTGADLPFLTQLCASALALMPIAAAFGWLFPFLAKRYAEERGSLARAYAIESAGGLIGGALASWWLSLGFQNLTIAMVGALIAIGVSINPVKYRGRTARPSRFLVAAAAVVGLLCVLTLWRTAAIDRAWTAWNHPHLLDTSDTPYGRVTVSGRLGQISVFENNALVFDSEGTAAEELVHLAASHHPDPKTFLLLGGAAQGLVREAQKYRPRRITAVELDRRAWELVSRYVPNTDLQSPIGPRAELRFGDPRQYLMRNNQTVDLILVAMPEPGSAQTARYYTREFFELCARRLTPNGILAFRLRSAENLWTPHLFQRTAAISAALRAAFPAVTILPGTANLFIASRRSLPKEPDGPANLLRARRIETRLVSPLYLRYLYSNDRFEYISKKLATVSVTPNLDSRPVCYQYSLIMWLSKFYPGLAATDLDVPITWAKAHLLYGWLLLLALIGVFRLARRRRSIRRTLIAGLAGLLGMVAESALLVRYQVSVGVLYQDLGILLTLFMAGLVIGSLAVSHLAVNRYLGRLLPRGLGIALLVAFSALAVILARVTPSSVIASTALVGGALLLTGALVAALFAYASVDPVDDASRIISPLYAADLLGGCIGSLAASLVLIPLAGIDHTWFGMTFVAIAALALF